MKGKMFLIMGALLVISYFLYEYMGGPKKPKEKNPAKIVTGVVSDSKGNKVSKATIYLLGAEIKAHTDRDGEYSIEARPGNEFIVSHPKYKRKAIEVKAKTVNIVLDPKDDELKNKIEEDFPEMDIQ